MTARVGVVTVAYDSTDVLPVMLASLPQGTPVVIVDNGSRDLARLRAIAADFGAELVENGRNLGFGPACNVGAQRLDCEFLLFLNPDAQLDPAALGHLLAVADAQPRAAAFGPVIEDQSGAIDFKWRTRLLSGQPPRPAELPVTPIEAPMLSGAALMVRRSAFEAIGGFDPNIFLYFEDDDLSVRLRQTVGPLFLVPQARVAHAGGQSSPSSPELTRFKWYHWERSRIHVERKHHRPAPLMRSLLARGVNLLNPRAWVSPHARARTMGRLQGALSMVRPGA